MICKGICLNYQIKESHRNLGLVDSGVKNCSTCKRYLRWFNKRCPCCKNTLLSQIKETKKKNQMHQNFIYKKFLFKLKLSKEDVKKAKNLEDDLLSKIEFDIVPEVMATTCIYLVSHLEQSKTLEEILDVFKIPEVEVRFCMAKICENLPTPLE